ncbi:MAG: ABC transporter transmembrane domain-containing protein, partial [Candidatus Sungbacteria bacterium]|nr:ABC transporter transmembrane domain-containing protein [Candidatus Sungbacteria bacterium]
IVTRPFLIRTKRYAFRAVDINKIIAHRMNESVTGMKTIKASGVDEAVVKREKKVLDELRQLLIKSSIVKGIGSGMTEPLTFVFIAAVFAFSYKHTDFNFASFAVVMYLVQRIFNSVRKTQGAMHVMNQGIVHAHHVLDLSEAVVANKEESLASDSFVFSDAVEFRNVSFAYESGRPILQNVSFQL